MSKTDPQQLYAACREIAAAPICDRAGAFQRAGGLLTPPQDDNWDYLNSRWRAELMDLKAHGDSRVEAVSAWLKLARRRIPHRATDRRPDCPYNGQPPAP